MNTAFLHRAVRAGELKSAQDMIAEQQYVVVVIKRACSESSAKGKARVNMEEVELPEHE